MTSTPHLTINDFFTRLSSLFDSRRTSTHGSVYLSQKRHLAPPSPLPILIRASNGKCKDRRSEKIKISTIVQPDELEGFFTRYAEIMKAGTPMLKKRDRSGRKKAKAKKKQKGGGEVEKK
ncbi:MAG: hypothetical protein Q9222_003723 [Ikaeria aurantiellina]